MRRRSGRPRARVTRRGGGRLAPGEGGESVAKRIRGGGGGARVAERGVGARARESPGAARGCAGCAAESWGLTKAHRSEIGVRRPGSGRQASPPATPKPPPSRCRRARSGAVRPASSLPSRQLRRTVQGVQKTNDNERSRWWRACARAVLSLGTFDGSHRARGLRVGVGALPGACSGLEDLALGKGRGGRSVERDAKASLGRGCGVGRAGPPARQTRRTAVLGAPNTARSTLKPPTVIVYRNARNLSNGQLQGRITFTWQPASSRTDSPLDACVEWECSERPRGPCPQERSGLRVGEAQGAYPASPLCHLSLGLRFCNR